MTHSYVCHDATSSSSSSSLSHEADIPDVTSSSPATLHLTIVDEQRAATDTRALSRAFTSASNSKIPVGVASLSPGVAAIWPSVAGDVTHMTVTTCVFTEMADATRLPYRAGRAVSCICIHVYMYICMYICLCVCVCLCVFACVCVCFPPHNAARLYMTAERAVSYV